jgi:tRNA pseudouridine32 synthase/23S rRNA pseudouridine746 synthase
MMLATLPPIVYRDERLVVFDKPAGLLSVPGLGREKLDSLATRAAAALPGARIVHRLDRDTSGLIVLALDPEAHRNLSVQFQERLVEKTYEAVVAGVVADDAGAIDLPIRKDLEAPPRHRVDHERGRPSRTEWVVVRREADRTHLRLHPRTGRSHQLRLHLLAIGHPILGDDLYAPPDVQALAPRLMLHASGLSFAHPSTAAPMSFTSRPPWARDGWPSADPSSRA